MPPGTRDQHAEEQDKAAGGLAARSVKLANGGVATASICLKHLPKSRRVYAYLRYSVNGKTRTKYVGDATASTRYKALSNAWVEARERGLMDEQH